MPSTGGGTDAGFAAQSGKPTVLESFALAGFGFHAKDEFIEIDSIVPCIYVSTRLLMELGKYLMGSVACARLQATGPER